MAKKLNVNPVLLKWCREQTGYSVDEVVRRIKLSPIKSTKRTSEVSPQQRLHQWERGEDAPGYTDLKRLASCYKQPLLIFFMPHPPLVQEKLIDFRTVGSLPHRKDTPEFAQLKRQVFYLQETLSDLLQDEGASRLDFINSISPKANIVQFVKTVRQKLSFSYAEQKSCKKDETLFTVLRKKIEELGVFVLVRGSREKISVEEFRGMAISDEYAPMVVINGSDGVAARIFSVLHELAHLFLGDSSLYNSSPNIHDPKEVFCNRFAAEFMMPTQEVDKIFPHKLKETSYPMQLLSSKAKENNISITTLVYRLLDVGKISRAMADQVVDKISKNVKIKPKVRSGGPSRNTMDRFCLGDKVISTVLDARDEGIITDSSAAALLNVKEYRFSKIRPQ